MDDGFGIACDLVDQESTILDGDRKGRAVSLRQRIKLIEKPRDWLNQMAEKYHYMHREVHQQAVPFLKDY